MAHTKPQFQFQAAKSVNNMGEGLPGAVQKSLEQFQRQVSINLKRGEGTVQTVVTNPEADVYFGIVLAGPFSTLATLEAALAALTEGDLVEQLRRIGIE